ncbi:MAG: ARMT1-like domain-containing protein [Burkholderiaceae bacterium]|nr:ARMT1-like domain-containing protein [Burkholderiaceae bacterium]
MSLDCVVCFVRQSLDAARLVTNDHTEQERIVRDLLRWLSDQGLEHSPPVLAQIVHRKLREISQVGDPYAQAKARHNAMALDLLPELRAQIAVASDPLAMATRLAIAGNVIDMGMNSMVAEDDVRESIRHALAEPFVGEWDDYRTAVADAKNILYLADNAGEIAFDRLLIEQLGPNRVTVAVRGAPVLNDATRADADAVGLSEIVTVIDNGSDAQSTLLYDCAPELQRRFAAADMIIAKGQGNFESLGGRGHDVFFLFKVKCPVIAAHVGLPLGTQVLRQYRHQPAA